jgi:hypothetical protein
MNLDRADEDHDRVLIVVAGLLTAVSAPQPTAQQRLSIIDVHPHAHAADHQGPPPSDEALRAGTLEVMGDIFYDNAARFRRLSDAEIARHRAM